MKLTGVKLENVLQFAESTLDLSNDVQRYCFGKIERGFYRTALEYLHYEKVNFELQQMVASLLIQSNIDGKINKELMLLYKLEQ